jgi:hypothetical protein
MGGEESSLPAVLSWVAWMRDLIFAGYWRAATTSGDRAGILACNSVAKALRAQVKISVGTNQINEVHLIERVHEGATVPQRPTLAGTLNYIRFGARLSLRKAKVGRRFEKRAYSA